MISSKILFFFQTCKTSPAKVLPLVVAPLLATLLSGCGSLGSSTTLLISVEDQKLVRVEEGVPRAVYPISTSKYGVGSRSGSMATPLGNMVVAKKIGDNAPSGAVFKSRQSTGEVLAPDAPGRDPVVTRIMWLSGLDSSNRNTFSRCIYIHGTPEESKIGHPASFGCIRMKSRDVIDLYNTVSTGAKVKIIEEALPVAYRHPAVQLPTFTAQTASAAKPEKATSDVAESDQPASRSIAATTPPPERPEAAPTEPSEEPVQRAAARLAKKEETPNTAPSPVGSTYHFKPKQPSDADSQARRGLMTEPILGHSI